MTAHMPICPLMSTAQANRIAAPNAPGASLMGVPCAGRGCAWFIPMLLEGQAPNEEPRGGVCATVAISFALAQRVGNVPEQSTH